MADKFKYIEIVRMTGDVVVKRMDVTGKSERSIERIQGGVNINLNHKEFYVRTKGYKTEKPDTDEKQS